MLIIQIIQKKKKKEHFTLCFASKIIYSRKTIPADIYKYNVKNKNSFETTMPL